MSINLRKDNYTIEPNVVKIKSTVNYEGIPIIYQIDEDHNLMFVGIFSNTGIKLYCEEKDSIKMRKIIAKINELWEYHDYEK